MPETAPERTRVIPRERVLIYLSARLIFCNMHVLLIKEFLRYT